MAADPDPQAALARHIVYARPEELEGADRNPKGHQLEDIKAGILRHGFTAPAVLDERTTRLVAGHGRRDAVIELEDEQPDHPDRKVPDGIVVDAEGRWTMPVVRGWASRDDEHAEAMLVLDNRSTENGGWDNRVLAELLSDVADYSPDLLAATGFTENDLRALLDGFGDMPDLDALAGEVGEPTDEDALVRVSFKVPPDVAQAWKDALAATGTSDETKAATVLVRAAYDSVTAGVDA